MEETERDCLWCRADAEGRRVIRTKIYFVGVLPGSSRLLSCKRYGDRCMKLWRPRASIHTPHLPPDDFTPNCEMNGFADYMSNAFCSSSLCDAQMEHSADTHVFAYPRTLGLFKMRILLPC